MIDIADVKAASEITLGSACMRGPFGNAQYVLAAPGDFSAIPDLFSYPVKNFGRFPDSAKAACVACALLMKAAGLSYKKGEQSRTALLCAGYDPTAAMNEAFFRDYVDNGRTMGRGNLFIYTLPTSPAGEVSIHFGFAGPVFFLEADHDPQAELVRTAKQLLNSGQAIRVVCLHQDTQSTRGKLLDAGQEQAPLRPFRRRSS